jgi:hypothetical protein
VVTLPIARPGGLRRPEVAGELRQLLHMQRRRPGPHLQRSDDRLRWGCWAS